MGVCAVYEPIYKHLQEKKSSKHRKKEGIELRVKGRKGGTSLEEDWPQRRRHCERKQGVFVCVCLGVPVLGSQSEED